MIALLVAIGLTAMELSPTVSRLVTDTWEEPPVSRSVAFRLSRQDPAPDVPALREGSPYRAVREQLRRSGWRPAQIPGADQCRDARCRGFGEVVFCAGTGRASCLYAWQKGSAYLIVWAWREGDQLYDSHQVCARVDARSTTGEWCVPYGTEVSPEGKATGGLVEETLVLTTSNAVDAWTTSVFAYDSADGRPAGLNNEELRVGGWGDTYVSYIQFPTPPTNATRVWLEFYNAANEGSGTDFYVIPAAASWAIGQDNRLSWARQPRLAQQYRIRVPSPPRDDLVRIDITPIHRAWASGALPNNGLALIPVLTNNNYVEFISTEGQSSFRPTLTWQVPDERRTVGESMTWISPVDPVVSSPFFDPTYPAQFYRQHLGVDLTAAAGTSVVSPVSGQILHNETGRADINEAYLIVEDASSGFEHVLAHVSSDLRVGAIVRQGQVIATVRAWPGEPNRAHVHWGINRNSALPANGWGWGRAPASVTESQALARGWINPSRLADTAPAAAVAAAAEFPAGFIGRWRSQQAGCQYNSTEDGLEIARDGVRMYYRSRLDQLQVISPGEVKGSVIISGEGQTYLRAFHYRLEPNGRTLSVIDDDGSIGTLLRRCP